MAYPPIKGRSFKRGEVTPKELLALARGFDSAKELFGQDVRPWAHDVLLVEGDLTVAGPLRLFDRQLAALLVTGNLTVRGLYKDGDDPASGLIVLGDMDAENIVTAGSLSVGGDLRVREGLIGDYNDYSAEIRGETRARLLHTEEHWFEFKGAVHADVVLGRPRGRWPRSTKLLELPRSEYPHRLVEGVFDPELLVLDKKAVRRRAMRGLPILLGRATSKRGQKMKQEPRAQAAARTYQDVGARFFRTSRRAWVIWREETVVAYQDGKPTRIGATQWAEVVRVEFPSGAAARAEVARRIAEKAKQGFTE